MQKSLKVLFVGASNNGKSSLRNYLEKSGFEPHLGTARSVDEFTAALLSDEWDCVTAFDEVARFSALDAYAVLRETGSNASLFVISPAGDEFTSVKSFFCTGEGWAHDAEPRPLASALDSLHRDPNTPRPRSRIDLSREMLRDIARARTGSNGLAEFLQKVHYSIRRAIDTENCSLLLRDPLTGRADFEYWIDSLQQKPEPKSPLRTFADHVLHNGKPLLVNNESRTSLGGASEIVRSAKPWAAWIGVPLRSPSRTFGVLALHDYDEDSSFDERDLDILSLVADQVAIAIEKKRSERALRESEERYRMLFDHAPDGIIISDPTARILDINASLCRILDYSRNEALTLTPAEMVAAEELPEIERSLAALSANSEHHREWKLRRKDGSIVCADVSSTKMPDNNILAIVRDVSERKRAEQALIGSEERYRDLVENAIDIIYVHDFEGNYLSINDAAETITGYTRAEILSMRVGQITAPEYLERSQEMLAAKLAGKEATAYEVEIIAKDGRRVALEVNTKLIYSNGSPVGVQGIARDVTERKLLEEKYRQSQKMEAIGLLAGGISHDFNNLLTAINGYSEITLAKMAPDDPLRQNIEEIKETGERASALTQQLLAFSRKQVLQPVVHNPNSVVRDMDRMLRRIIRADIEFRLDLDNKLNCIEADPGQLEQVIINLAINARDAMPNGGRLTIRTENVNCSSAEGGPGDGSFVRMTVSDTGEGIDDLIRDRIFEPFFTTKEAGKGSGLGLATVHGIVKQSGGEIVVRSTIGEGTTFEIYFPAVGQSSGKAPCSCTKGGDSLSGDETVLLVEDDPVVRKLVREILANKGYEVLEAPSGEEAMEICENYSGPIDLLLTDLVMPKMSGLELTDKVFRVHPEAKPLVMTGYTGMLGLNELLPRFQSAYIEKPFTPDVLARKVREVLEQHVTADNELSVRN